MDRLSTDAIKGIQSLSEEAKEFVEYAEKTREEVEELFLRSPLSWEVLAEEALHFPGRLDYGLERLNERIVNLQGQANEAEATLTSLCKLHPVPGTDEFAECEHEGQVAQLMLAAVEEPLQKLKRARDSLPAVAVIMEGVARVLEVGLPHVAENVGRGISSDANRIRSVALLIDSQLTQYEELVSSAEAEVGKKLECPTFHRDLLDQVKVEELVELRG